MHREAPILKLVAEASIWWEEATKSKDRMLLIDLPDQKELWVSVENDLIVHRATAFIPQITWVIEFTLCMIQIVNRDYGET